MNRYTMLSKKQKQRPLMLGDIIHWTDISVSAAQGFIIGEIIGEGIYNQWQVRTTGKKDVWILKQDPYLARHE